MASDIIAKKRKIRSGHKAYTTKLLNEAKEFQFTDGESSSEIKDKLRQLERSLKERLNILSGLDEEILNATEDEEAIMEEIETAGQFRDGIHAVLVKIEEQLKDKPSSYNLEAVPVSKSPSKETVSTRLPKLILRKFAGEPKDWIPFWDQFKNAVHENTSLSEVDKFNYLKSLLEGNAATTIQALALTAANYESAVQLLHQRFGNKQVIISSHMDALLRLHAVGSQDIRALRKTYDKIEAHVKGLQALDVPTSTYGSLLVPVLMSKIPEDIRLLLGREVKDGEWDLDKILDLLREEVENRERCGGIQALSLTETRKQGSSMNASHKSNMTTAAALIVNEKKVNCSYCRGNHTSAKCHVVTNVNARKDILRKEGRCFICLKRGHLSRSCDAKYSCSRCSSKHHISICDKHYGISGMSNIEAGNAPHSVNTRALNIQEGSSPRARSNQITHNFNPRSTCPEGNSTSPMAQAFVPYPSHSLYAAQTPTRLSQNVESTGNPTPVGSLHMSGKEPVPLQTTQAFVPNPHSFYAGHTQSLPQQAIPTNYPTTTSSLHVSAKDSVLLQTAQAYVGTERIRLIFDSGSQKSYVTERIRSKLGLQPLDKESLLINTFGSADKGKPTVCDSVGLTVLDVKGETSTTIKALVVSTICAPLGKQEIKKAQREYDYIRNLEMADSNNDASEVHIDLLIGADYMWKFFTGKTRQGIQKEGPVASETVLGWVLSGPVPSSHSSKLSSVNFVSTHVLRVAAEEPDNNGISENKDLSQLWDFESIGIRDKETVHESFVKNISLENGRYCVTLPRKETHETLPDNYDLSLARLNNLVKRLRKEPEIMREYNQTFQDQLSLGIIEKVDHPGQIGQTHYLPHQAIIRNDVMTTKLRVVFDASAKAKASLPCLNDTMHTGPAMTPEIFQILARFRCHRIGLAADIEKAFLNIAIQNEQRDLTRFLWIDDINAVDPNIVIYHFCRVIFGMNCSPFLLNATLNYHVKQYYTTKPALAERILSGLYVDDWTGGGQTEKEALELYREAKTCFANGMFNLRKWVSNDKTLSSRIKQDRVDREEEPSKTSPTVTTDNETYAKTTLGHLDELDATTEHKVLGLNWNLEDDKVYLKVDAVAEFAEKLEPTKRNVLKIAAKMFDPLGIISPVMVNFRFLLQELCVAKYDWDTLISTAEQRQLKKWLKSLESVGSFAINRYYFSDLTCDAEVKHVSLHGFGDASKKGYCAVVYLCIETTEGYQTSLVASKSRVAPIAPTTIPRLELVAALILSRLMSTIKQALSTIIKIEQCRYWTDSKTVLYWITSSKEYKQFVQNRVDEIHSLTNTSDWGHCPGVENPADLGSRGCLAIELLESKAWWEGPPWLRKAPDNYPKVHCSLEEELPEECTKERRLKMDGHEHNSICLVNTQVSQGRKVPTNMSEEFKPEKYSSFFKLLRVTATVWRFIKYLKSKLKKETVAPKSGAMFTTKELRGAEEKWIREAQRNLKNHKNLSHQLGLFKDGNNILRCRGRLANAPLKEETKFPILLPKEHHITKLIVEDVHYRLMHGGVKETLAELREKYWIPRGRGFIKRILHKCVTCRKTEGKAFNPPSSANLPENRVANLPAFTHVGVDFAGPLYVKKEEKKTESSMKKVYICLFVCASSRALHLELCPSLSADAFNRCLRRFIVRRGVPTSITSDNAKTFRHAAKEISNLFKSKEVRDFTEQKRIDWKFILEKAPWWGGFYERMVQLVKRRLRKVLGNAKVTYEELSTLLAEIEGILNSRPITYVYADVEEEPLTPAHLLIGRRLTTLPEDHATSDAEEEEYNAAECLTRRARYVNKLLQHFWQRWRREYLVDLREYHNLKGRSQSERNVKVGDIVIVQGDDLPRAKWRTGEVKELLPSRDGETRGVTLRVLNKKGSRVITLRRPVQQLYPLEVTSHRHSEQRGESTQDSSKNRNTDQVPTRRDRPPRRAAAQNADFIRKLVDQ